MTTFDKRRAGKMPGWEAPGMELVAITPHDVTDISGGYVRAIWVGGDGNIAVVPLDGTVVTLVGAKAGSLIPIACTRVNSTNTTATNLVGIR
jgi:hypothetical protein